MSKRKGDSYLGGHTLVPRGWLSKRNQSLERKHAKWAEEGEAARARADAKKSEARDKVLLAANAVASKPPKVRGRPAEGFKPRLSKPPTFIVESKKRTKLTRAP